MSAISWGAAPSPARKKASGAACSKSPGTAPSRSNCPAASSGRSWKMAVRLSCAAGVRATATALGLARSRARSRRRGEPEPSFRDGALAPDPESRDSGFDALHRPGMTRSSSPLFRRNIPQPRRMRSHILEAVLQMHALVGRRLLVDADARPRRGHGPDRPGYKTAAAVRADVVQFVLGAVRTERAFVGTDPRLRRVRRQVLVAIFAVRPELQRHGGLVR